MFALADVNSFYASCEKVFRPNLRGKPVICLSNNDGCVIARSAEAKLRLGIKMGTPWFKLKDAQFLEKLFIFSSNYELYASLSNRVVALLEELSPRVEQYSIDKCFHLDGKTEYANARHPGHYRAAVNALDRIWVPGHRYAKAGVMLNDFSPNGVSQLNLFDEIQPRPHSDEQIKVLDGINQSGPGKGLPAEVLLLSGR